MGEESNRGITVPELVGQGWGLSQFVGPPIRSCLLVTRFQTGLFLVKNSKNGSLRQNIGKHMADPHAYVRAETPKNLGQTYTQTKSNEVTYGGDAQPIVVKYIKLVSMT